MAAYGADEFPAFFTRHSGCRAPARVDTPPEAAALIAAAQRLGLGSGMVLAVPIPEEHTKAGEWGCCASLLLLYQLQQGGPAPSSGGGGALPNSRPGTTCLHGSECGWFSIP